ncbi:hypothetical protein NLJ89_g3546 [Agrocybe chaxingu]|uniref:Carboxylic ester hydrolase n=1 Tax=Agrocybe chaxingu TaxID=84603 RepID=A0A9W8K520_9AGAR|nr:hypothetical protein NLJ89_g3546 [Agrocybe chaxingu]
MKLSAISSIGLTLKAGLATLLYPRLGASFALSSESDASLLAGPLIDSTVTLDSSQAFVTPQAASPIFAEFATQSHPLFGNNCIATAQSTEVAGFSEDCLVGNVYIPANTRKNDKLPVLVYFHGGGFQGGTTQTAPPDQLLQTSAKPLIFASFEYRLGPLGFLGGSEVKKHGVLNAGMLDQRAALRWAQRYIGNFGGDRRKVTIWGQSAGAGSTMFHLIANGGNHEGLFRAAMGDSPSLSYLPAYNDAYVEGIYQKFVGFTACANKSTSAETFRCLRRAPVSDLIQAGPKLLASYPSTLFVFAPILDGTFLSSRAVAAFSSTSLGPAKFAQVPLLFGSNADEGTKWSSTLPDPLSNTSMPFSDQETVVRFLQGQYASLPREPVDEAMGGLGLYPFSKYGDVGKQAEGMYGEARYICTAGLLTGGASSRGIGDVYQYYYYNPHLGSDHGSELAAFFSTPSDADANDLELFKTMREYWTSFVTDGRPKSKSGLAWKSSSDRTGSPRLVLHPAGIMMETIDEDLSARCSYWRGMADDMST